MVRFKAAIRDPESGLVLVSIPLWCDLKLLAGTLASSRIRVSIPLWCDLKSQELFRKALAIYVSIPLWCDLKISPSLITIKRTPCFHPTMVRFKAHHLRAIRRSHAISFHPTMVRFKAVYRVDDTPVKACFHPTMVRFKGGGMAGSRTLHRPFPSHYGAI